MRSKAPLVLIEQAAMLVVFALAAALCLRAFVWADSQSSKQAAYDSAVIQAQNAAEMLKHLAGNFEQASREYGGCWADGQWTICYDENWVQTDGKGEYFLRASPAETGLECLGSAEVRVLKGETVLFSLDVCWQEVGPGG